MSQVITHRPAEDHSQKGPHGNHNYHIRKDDRKEVAMVGETQCRDNIAEYFAVVSHFVMLDKIRDTAGAAVTNEVKNLLHHEKFNMAVSRK